MRASPDRLGLPHLTIRNGTLVTSGERRDEADTIQVRPADCGRGRCRRSVCRRSPGTEVSFHVGRIDRIAPPMTARVEQVGTGPRRTHGGAPETGDVCAFCRLVDTASRRAPVALDLLRNTEVLRR